MADAMPKERRVLVVEDVEPLAFLMTNLLRNQGYAVEVAGDGEACMQQLRTFAPDLIILDIMLPRAHGIDVLKRLRENEKTRRLGVIVCTAKTFKPDLDQIRALGVTEIIVKPFEKEVFLRTVGRFFGQTGDLGQEKLAAEKADAESQPYLPQISPATNFIRFWGTRGSIPVSAARYVRHGGNTSCVVVGRGDESVIIDAGSGIRDAGLELAKAGPQKLHLFITHTHWDHIQGFPFFAPIYIPGFEIAIYGASTFGKDLQSIFRGQLDRDYFPIQFEDMKAKFEFHILGEKPIRIGGLKISWEFTNHPAATVGFKIESARQTVAYVSDNEFLQGHLGSPHRIQPEDPILLRDQKMIGFLKGVDLLIHEAQYTNQEYAQKIGWGHTSLSNACLLASLSGAQRWVVTHHDPMHDDDFLEAKLNLTKEILRSMNCSIAVTHAHDGQIDYF
ncbi:MAG: response regulator [Verrucomicrobia bacterium]|nr:response regulator [Verrucomicrobiota bacterium]